MPDIQFNAEFLTGVLQSVATIYVDQGIKMIIFESILTTYIASVILRECFRNSKNWLELKIDPP